MGIVPLVADLTGKDPEMTELIKALNGKEAPPVLAIFPAGSPNKPIVLSGFYTKPELIEWLRKAGPSYDARSSDEAALTSVGTK